MHISLNKFLSILHYLERRKQKGALRRKQLVTSYPQSSCATLKPNVEGWGAGAGCFRLLGAGAGTA